MSTAYNTEDEWKQLTESGRYDSAVQAQGWEAAIAAVPFLSSRDIIVVKYTDTYGQSVPYEIDRLIQTLKSHHNFDIPVFVTKVEEPLALNVPAIKLPLVIEVPPLPTLEQVMKAPEATQESEDGRPTKPTNSRS